MGHGVYISFLLWVSGSLQEMAEIWNGNFGLDKLGSLASKSLVINQEVFMSSVELLTWGLVAMSLTGNIFVNKKNVIGQWLWAVANVGWISYDFYIGAYSQAFLFSAYLVICIWGIISWTKQDQLAKSSS
jgi:hypothetical protein